MAKRPGPDEPQEPSTESTTVNPQITDAVSTIAPGQLSTSASVVVPPGRGGTVASAPEGALKPAFSPPSPQKDFDPTKSLKVRRNQGGEEMVMYTPASGHYTTIGTSLLGDCAIANGLGTREPLKVFISFNEDNTLCFVMPVGPLAAKGVDVSYQEKRAVISFWASFADKGKSVPDGYKEIYQLYMTEDPVTIHGTAGYALYFSLKDFKSVKRDTRDPAAVAAAKAGKAKAKQSTRQSELKAKLSNQGSTEAQSGDEAAANQDPEASAADQTDEMTAIDRAYEAMLDDREAQLKELQKQLKAYKKKFGDM